MPSDDHNSARAHVIRATAALAVALCALCAATPCLAGSSPSWHNSLAPAGDAVAVVLARDGVARYTIVLPAQATPPERRAAAELQRWLGEMAGTRFETVPEKMAAAHSPVISVGNTMRLATADLNELGAGLAPEGYAIAMQGDDIFLVGGQGRGPINAAFALLEEDLGCRWYAADAAVIPQLTTAEIVPRSYSPLFGLRDPFSHVSNNAAWSLRNRTNSYAATQPAEIGGNLSYAPGWFVHTYRRILAGTPGNLAACPGCFMLSENGVRSRSQLCPTHPRVVELAIEKAGQALAAHPGAELLSISPNDTSQTHVESATPLACRRPDAYLAVRQP